MLKSKDITHFVSAKISELRADEPVPTDLHLFLAQNRHIILWKPAGTVFSEEDLKKYGSEGLECIWIHTEEWPLFENFLHPRSEQSPTHHEEDYHSELQAEALLDLLRGKGPAEGKSPQERTSLVSVAARTLLKDLGNASTLARQKTVNAGISSIIKQLVTDRFKDKRTLATQIWKISGHESHPLRAVNVATFSVLFSMAFGHSDEAVLTDVSLAALLYGIGFAQIPLCVVQKTSDQMTSAEKNLFSAHTSSTLRLVEQFAPDFSLRARTLIPQPGEPRTEMAQLIAMAEALDSCCSGQENGIEKTFTQALLALENKSYEHPAPFNREKVAAILKWIREENVLAA